MEADRLVAAAAAVCHDPIAGAWQGHETAMADGLVAALRTGAESHAEAVRSLGLDGAPPGSWLERADTLLEYRKLVVSELLEPLVAQLESSPSRGMLMALEAALDEAARAVADLPETERAPWPEGALDPAPSDSFARRRGKPLARWIGAARKTGVDRDLPFAATVAHHLISVVAPAEDAALAARAEAWAEWAGGLERAWVEWAEEALPALVAAELPDAEDAEGAEGAEGPWGTVAEAAGALQTSLEALAETAPSGDAVATASGRLGRARAALKADLAVAGSFLARPGDPKRPVAPTRARRVVTNVEQWDSGVAARLTLYRSVLAILAGATAVQRRLVWRFHETCRGASEAFPEVADDLIRTVESFDVGRAGEPLEKAFAELQARVQAAVQPALSALPDAAEVQQAASTGSDATVEALLSMIRQAPETLPLHSEVARPPRGTRRTDTRPLALRQLARQSFDALRLERIRASTEGLIHTTARLREEVAGIPDVLSFAFESAADELERAEEGAEERASELVGDALASIAETLRTHVRDLRAAVEAVRLRLATEIHDGSSALLDRVGAGRVHARLLAARSRLADRVVWLTERLGPPARRLSRAVTRRWRVLRRLATRGLAKGSEIVAGPTAEKVASTSAIRALAEHRRITAEAPLVYQRLFTLEPLADPALLVGREAPLNEALRRWKGWTEGDGVPLVVRGRQGSGITSFLNVLGDRIAETGATVVRVGLDSRLVDDAAVAARIGEALGVPEARTLQDLSEAFSEPPANAPLRAVIMDELEHLYLRVPGGTDLIERVLTLMAETEPTLFWVCGISQSAWQIVAATEPTAISQVDLLDLPSLEGAELRAAVTVRHRRSGLPTRFEELPRRGPVFLHRLRRLQDAERHRKQVEDAYFEQLARASSGQLRLALFQWLQHADFDRDEGLVMRIPKRPDFSVLDTLDLTQNFTLKAFLEHRTLTLAEHDRIFRLPRQESFQIFESLHNRHLIRAVPTGTAADGDGAGPPEERYELQPLLAGAIAAHLRGRNILH